MTKYDIGLKFPESIDGTTDGISDAGIETFAGNPFQGLAREQAQNSIDAAVDNPVRIHVDLLQIRPSDLPGYRELKFAIEKAREYWIQNPKTVRALDRAERALSGPHINCLRITDRNTTGLTGSSLKSSGNWFNLTKASGVSEKSGGKGGSFGIGKNAFFANSLLRTVYFQTHDVNGESAFQGVSKLVSHEGANNKLTKGTGFYGILEGYLPITERDSIPSIFQSTGIGTDIVIAGFDVKEQWREAIVAAYAENFFVAIHSGLLEVSISRDESGSDHHLNATNIGEVICGLANREPKRYRGLLDYFECLVSPDALEFDHEIKGLGKLSLRLLQKDGSNKKIAMFRKTGMKIFYKDRFRTPVEFVGVFQCLGDEGNELLRRLEPPSHDKWEYERFEDEPRFARRILDELNGWLRERVAGMQPVDTSDQQAVPGLEKFLPDDFEDSFDATPTPVGEGDAHSKEQPPVNGVVRPVTVGPAKAGHGGESERDERENSGTRRKAESDRRSPTDALSTNATEVEVPHRIFREHLDTYRMVISFENPGSYEFAINAVGDDGRTEIISINDVRSAEFANVNTLENRIRGIVVISPTVATILFRTASIVPRTLTVKAMKNG